MKGFSTYRKEYKPLLSFNWNDDLGVLFFIIFVLTIVVGIAIICKNKSSQSKQQKFLIKQDDSDKEKEIQQFIPEFHKEEFQHMMFEKYKKIQTAYMNFDNDILRQNCTEDLYQQYHSQLKLLKEKQKKNMMHDFEQITFRLIDVNKKDKELSIKLRTVIWCYDDIVDQNKKLIQDHKKIYHYEMTLITNLQKYKTSQYINDDCWLFSQIEIISQE